MTPTWQFWLTWITQLAGAVGTISAVVVALFGTWLRHRLVPPALQLTIENKKGLRAEIALHGPDGEERKTDSRWYHARVSNLRRWSPATQVQVFLLQVEEPDALGENKITWVGALPLRWREQEIYPVVRTIGYFADCDLCSVVKDKWLEMHPLVNLIALKTRFRSAHKLTITLQARSLEADSNYLRLQLAWDGKWSDDSEEMARHMVIREVAVTKGGAIGI